MNADRIKEIQKGTAYPDSVSVQQALLQVWNECEQQPSEWIRVEDRTPLENTEVLCYNGYRMIPNSWMAYTGMDEERFKEKFTHWMPLPSPPKD